MTLLDGRDVPQADDPARLVALARHLVEHGGGAVPPGFGSARDVSYCRSALRILGWVDESGAPLDAARVIPTDLQGQQAAFQTAFEGSAVGRAWLAFAAASSLSDIDPATGEALLAACSTLSEETRKRRAGTLRRWLSWMRRPSDAELASDEQLGLFAPRNIARVAELRWPPSARFPHNEADARVEQQVNVDLEDGSDALVVVGYASLDHVIRLLARYDGQRRSTLRVLFGNEPFPTSRSFAPRKAKRLADEVRDYWLNRGISPEHAGDLLAARAALEGNAVEVRTAPPGRAIHAKIYGTARAVTLGSSNYTANGMRLQSEANVRFVAGDDRYAEAMQMASGLWQLGVDYRRELIELLDRLLKAVTWQEALARACAEVLEGTWAQKYVPPEALEALERPLWPHQLQGISQAMWILHNVGSVLVADAAGSGKTRMGAWLVRAAYDRQFRAGRGRFAAPVVVVPPGVIPEWKKCLKECGLPWEVHSHGPLSNPASRSHHDLPHAIRETDLLAVDEAHNFLHLSKRTERLRNHYADDVALFTATPINTQAADLLSHVSLLGPDNFPDDALKKLRKLQRVRASVAKRDADAVRDGLRDEISRFMVRRTRADLNTIVAAHGDSYRLSEGRLARYPRHHAAYYELPCRPSDVAAAERIVAIADQLLGVGRLPKTIEYTAALRRAGLSEEVFLKRTVLNSAALARHTVLACLRSSRIALFEHVHGTAAACAAFDASLDSKLKSPSGDTISQLSKGAGHTPEWSLGTEWKSVVPLWVWDSDAHARACHEDARRYREIGELVRQMSDDREQRKLALLRRLLEERGIVIAFDSHVLTLAQFHRQLERDRVPASMFIGEGGPGAKRRASERLGLASEDTQLIALCSDAFSEGLNLQKASVVVHLDTPTVIRTAEQRAGRVDRMDSPHDDVVIWWPRDPTPFAPRKGERIHERHEVVKDLIGSNLVLPGEADDYLDVESLAAESRISNEDPQPLFDAFHALRAVIAQDGLVGPATYERMRSSQADVLSCVSVVASETPWGFFAVGGLDRIAPRWVFLNGPSAAPESDFSRVVAALQDRLEAGTAAHPFDARAGDVIARLLTQLCERESELLPMRRQRALSLATRVIRRWRVTASERGDQARVETLSWLESMMRPALDGAPRPDLRSVADAWLKLFRPYQLRMSSERRRPRGLWTLDELREDLLASPIDDEALLRAFKDIPEILPLPDRVVAMIVGVPSVGLSNALVDRTRSTPS
jgi:hypothetical protein